MTIEIDLNDLLKIEFAPTERHQHLISEIQTLRNSTAKVDLSIVPEKIRQAFQYVQENFEQKELSEEVIQSIHKLLGESETYRTSPCEVQNGVGQHPYSPPDPQFVPGLMHKYKERYACLQNKTDPLQEICEAYFLFELIHPFDDGNGRTGRLICSWLTLKHGYEALSPYFAVCWGRKNNVPNELHVKAFQSEYNSYTHWLGEPELFQKYFSDFYLYFLEQIRSFLMK